MNALILSLVSPQSLAANILSTITKGISPLFAVGVILTGFYAIKNVKNIEYDGFGRLLFIIIGMGVYVHLASAIEMTISTLISYINGQDELSTRIASISDTIKAQPSSLAVFPSLYDWLREALADAIAQMIVIIMKRFQQFVLLFLYCTGPIALVLSSIPEFKGLFMNWFRNYIAVQFWGVTFVILDKILILITTAKIINNSSFGATPEEVISNNATMATLDLLIIVIAYLFVSTLTAYYIGRNEAGALTRQVVQTISQVATAVKTFGASAAAKAGASKFVSGGSTAKSATDAAGSSGGAATPGYSVGTSGNGNTSTSAGANSSANSNQKAQQTFSQPNYKYTPA